MLGNGKAHNHSEEVVGRLVAAGFLQDTERSDHQAVNAALEAALAHVSPGAPVIGFFATPEIKLTAILYLLLAHFETEVAVGEVSPQMLAATFVRARAKAEKSHAPASVQMMLTHLAEIVDWGLKPLGEAIDAHAIAAREVR